MGKKLREELLGTPKPSLRGLAKGSLEEREARKLYKSWCLVNSPAFRERNRRTSAQTNENPEFQVKRKCNNQYNRKRRDEWLYRLSGKSKVCELCGLAHPFTVAYTWHHLDPSKKEMTLGAINSARLDRDPNYVDAVRNEVAKCIHICHLCHYVHHGVKQRGEEFTIPADFTPGDQRICPKARAMHVEAVMAAKPIQTDTPTASLAEPTVKEKKGQRPNPRKAAAAKASSKGESHQLSPDCLLKSPAPSGGII